MLSFYAYHMSRYLAFTFSIYARYPLDSFSMRFSSIITPITTPVVNIAANTALSVVYLPFPKRTKIRAAACIGFLVYA